jgi:hypothetical protein
VKPLVIKNYKTHMVYVDLSDKMVNICSISKRMWKWARKLFFHLLDLAILNSYIVYKSCGGNMTCLKGAAGLRLRCSIPQREYTEVRDVRRGQPSSLKTQMST